MKADITNVRAGDIVVYHSFNGQETEYEIVSKSVTENYIERNKEIIAKGSLLGRTVTNEDFVRYNNFYCLPDGSFPSLSLSRQSHQEQNQQNL